MDRFVIDGLAIPPALRGAAVAIGNFDGIHRGHQHVLAKMQADARQQGVPALVMTFEPHPRSVIRPEKPVFRITGLAAKARILEALGLDGMVAVPFDREFSHRSAEAFVGEVLKERLAISAAVVGYDFHFGRDRGGSPAFLAEAGRRLGFAVSVVAPVADETGQPFSSARIRTALEAGDIAAANRLLGYRWFVPGTVIHGDARGRELGFPTANLSLGPDCRLAHGIYAVRVRRADGTVHDGVASYGRRPTFDNGAPLLEVFILDFADDLYGEEVTVSFIAWIRPEERFASVEALIARMRIDVEEARAALAAAGEGTVLDLLLAQS